ncbi:ribosomal-protein-alanine N-acetyltransferase [Falsibacillus pallidus]|uniref:Ribosomal-protein-alanine N-acetyltransferase n=2 Tax=Falsibacillus pallidus TaxID=493781 RepID=A0A370GBK8_9BACI|nr:ribosomal-protein-alanine N-acetyltransferase [Falsibacillus pallidus]
MMIESKIHTKRVLLRKFKDEDIIDFYEIVKKHEVGEWLGVERGMTFVESENYINTIINHWTIHKFGVWAVISKINNRIIGHCGLRCFNETQDVEIIYLLEPKFWGQGFATEAGAAAVQFAFESLKIDTLHARIRSSNGKSKNVIKKLGFSFVEDREYEGRTLSYYMMHNPT